MRAGLPYHFFGRGARQRGWRSLVDGTTSQTCKERRGGELKTERIHVASGGTTLVSMSMAMVASQKQPRGVEIT
jgi:hypothetical protein